MKEEIVIDQNVVACEKTAEKPMDTEVRINHLLTHKNVFLINFLRTFINPFYLLSFPTETYSEIKSCPIIPDCPTWQLGPWSPCQCTNRATCSCTGEQERQVWCTILEYLNFRRYKGFHKTLR